MASASAMLVFITQSGTGAKSSLDSLNTVVGIIESIITGVAIIIGGIWAYFKFIKGRTFRPRLELEMSGQWRKAGQKDLLHARIRVKNIGSSKVTLVQKGTGLRVSVLARDQPSPPALTSWDIRRVFEILKDHAWIEPEETVSDDILVDLGVTNPVITMFEARLVWDRRFDNIVVSAREVIPADALISGVVR